MTTPRVDSREGEGVWRIEVLFGAPVELSAEHERRLVSLIGEICEAYEATHEDRTMWPSGIGDAPSGIWTYEPSFDSSVFQIDCCERERFEDEKRYKSMTYEKQVIADAIHAIGWPQINAFQEELRKGQDVREDAGGRWVRCIYRLFGFRRRSPIQTYQDAAAAALTPSPPPSHEPRDGER